jgi:hypothetical protein
MPADAPGSVPGAQRMDSGRNCVSEHECQQCSGHGADTRPFLNSLGQERHFAPREARSFLRHAAMQVRLNDPTNNSAPNADYPSTSRRCRRTTNHRQQSRQQGARDGGEDGHSGAGGRRHLAISKSAPRAGKMKGASAAAKPRIAR